MAHRAPGSMPRPARWVCLEKSTIAQEQEGRALLWLLGLLAKSLLV